MSKSTIPTNAVELETLVTALVFAQLEREVTVAERDAHVLAAAAPFAEKIDALDTRVKADLKTLNLWSVANREAFGKLKSMAVHGHRFGWKEGNWKSVAKKPAKWDDITAQLIALRNGLNDSEASTAAQHLGALADLFLRDKTEIARDAIVAHREHEDAMKLLKSLGVSVEQEEEFFLTANREGQASTTIKA